MLPKSKVLQFNHQGHKGGGVDEGSLSVLTECNAKKIGTNHPLSVSFHVTKGSSLSPVNGESYHIIPKGEQHESWSYWLR